MSFKFRFDFRRQGKKVIRIVNLFSLMLLLMTGLHEQALGQKSLGVFDGQTDVGKVEAAGSVSYDAEKQEYIVEGGGSNMWFDEDAFYFVWKRISGDFILRARTGFLDSDGHPHRKLGWIVRSSLDADAPYVNSTVHADGLTSMQYRKSAGDSTSEKQSSISNADVIQLERQGNTYKMSVAQFGNTFSTEELTNISLGDSVYVGLFVCSHEPGQTTKAAFRNVRIVKPAPDTLVPYQDYLGSNLEIMDVETGTRKILHHSPKSLQAPNWTPDGETLIYNSEGLLYNFDLNTKQPEVLNTGFADNNNNDHVLSFDGSQIGISHHADEHDGNSIIYTLPIEGGTPQKVTAKGPSYLHGWSPDSKWLTYTGGRDGEYDIYKIPSDGGEEIKLTDYKGLDDGSEYSPDGEYIYFNSVRSGSMEIWRMHPDGSNHEQLTDDNLNNWFPHISPDGKRMIFLSYLPDVDPSDHPFYKQVYLRMMPVDGGEPKVVGYLYGGQGTINVPSWSPDGTKVGFISNTGM